MELVYLLSAFSVSHT
jgi:hypothetical protein